MYKKRIRNRYPIKTNSYRINLRKFFAYSELYYSKWTLNKLMNKAFNDKCAIVPNLRFDEKGNSRLDIECYSKVNVKKR